MLWLFELSGEHNTLPQAEVLATLNALGVDHNTHMFEGNLLVIDAEHIDVNSLSKRLAMTHSISSVLATCEADEEGIARMVSETSVEFNEKETFGVRVKSRNNSIKTTKLEREIGSIIQRKGYHVNLENPNLWFRLFITDKQCIFTLLASEIDRSIYEKRRPQLRPFFHPGVILPRMARCMVNLSQARENCTFLDPFCGTGGILIEASMLGTNPIGVDVQRRMIEGTMRNMRYYSLDAEVMAGDASRIALEDCSVDAVAMDPPYGQSALIKSSSMEKLYQDALEEVQRVLKPGCYAVVASRFPLEEVVDLSMFKVSETHQYRVHKSLTRHITALQNPISQ